MEKKFTLKPPIMPNFITVDTGTVERQEGFKTVTISVESLTQQEAQEYGELMKEEFIKHWNRLKKPKGFIC